ncbi:hypothetical protein N9L90_04535 [Planctomycetota bacterium]|nr:hypothetical protein [Planctomycetota bacterium]
MKTLSRILPVALGLTSVAAAQVTVIATEQFDYTAPGLLQNANTGTGQRLDPPRGRWQRDRYL